MAVQANPYLVITDGTTTVTIADGSGGNTSYILEPGNWTPAVAGLRRGQLGGAGPYEEVVEEMILHIKGADAATAYANLATLKKLIDQAKAFDLGLMEERTPVMVSIKYAPKGSTTASTATPYIARVLGPVENESGASLSAKWNQAGDSFIIDSVRVRFVRSGVWWCGSESASSAATNNGNTVTTTLTAERSVYSPTLIDFTNASINTRTGTGEYGHGGFLLVDGGTTAGAIFKTSLIPSAVAPWSSVAETAVTTVQRYTPTVTTEVLTPSGVVDTSTVETSKGSLWGVFISARNNSATTTFAVRFVETVSTTISPTGNSTPKIVIPGNSTPYPKWYYLGAVQFQMSGSLGVTASAASGTLDIDSIVFVRVNTPGVYVIGIGPAQDTIGFGTNLIINPMVNVYGTDPVRPMPALYNSLFVYAPVIPYTGDIAIYTRAQSVVCYWLATGGTNGAASPGNYFVQYNVGTVSVVQNTFTITRYIGYLVAV